MDISDQAAPVPSEQITARPPDPALPEVLPYRRRGWRTLVAWLVILAIVVGIVCQVMIARGSSSNTALKNIQEQSEDLTFRYLIGTYQLLRGFDPAADERIYADTKKMVSTGTATQQLRFAILAGELKGPAQALAELAELGDVKSPETASLAAILGRLYRDYERKQFDAPSISEAERGELRSKLGWMGEFALHPASGPAPEGRNALLAGALRTCFALLTAMLVFGFLGLAGFPCLFVVLILAWSRKLNSGLGTPSGTGGLYAETFALWLVLFVGLSVLFSWTPLAGLPQVFKGVAVLLTLGVLAWPVAWGVPWRQVREEVGLTWGRQPWLEPFLGVCSYVMSLPLLAVGLGLVVLLMKLQGWLQGSDLPAPPAHPVAENLGQANWWQLLQLLFLASVVAPIVEETMFRGVLYRHLRDATGTWRTVWSMLTSATVVGFLFAVIHPQGWVGVPALMSIAYGLTIAREWRGTLLPAMIGHGLNNFIMLMLATLLFRG